MPACASTCWDYSRDVDGVLPPEIPFQGGHWMRQHQQSEIAAGTTSHMVATVPVRQGEEVQGRWYHFTGALLKDKAPLPSEINPVPTSGVRAWSESLTVIWDLSKTCVLPARVEDTTVIPGRALTDAVLRIERARSSLICLIERFFSEGFFHSNTGGHKITKETLRTGKHFFEVFPVDKNLPRIAPDGEGGLMLWWEHDAKPLLVTVDDFSLHMVVAATKKDSRHFSNIQFAVTDYTIPKLILEEIPSR